MGTVTANKQIERILNVLVNRNHYEPERANIRLDETSNIYHVDNCSCKAQLKNICLADLEINGRAFEGEIRYIKTLSDKLLAFNKLTESLNEDASLEDLLNYKAEFYPEAYTKYFNASHFPLSDTLFKEISKSKEKGYEAYSKICQTKEFKEKVLKECLVNLVPTLTFDDDETILNKKVKEQVKETRSLLEKEPGFYLLWLPSEKDLSIQAHAFKSIVFETYRFKTTPLVILPASGFYLARKLGLKLKLFAKVDVTPDVSILEILVTLIQDKQTTEISGEQLQHALTMAQSL